MPLRPARALAATLVSAAVFAVAACAPVAAPGDGAVPDPGSQWRVTAIDGRPVPAGAVPTLILGPGEVSGRTGCNLYSGPFRAAGGSIAIGSLAVTEMACPGPAMATEAAFLAAVSAVDGLARRAGGGLVLTDGGRPRLELESAR